MPVTVTMPQLGESVTEGTITRWLKAVGDTVAADEPLLEVSTDKVDTEIPAPASGVLLSIDAAEDDTVEWAEYWPSSVSPTTLPLRPRVSRVSRVSRPSPGPMPRTHPQSPPHRQKLRRQKLPRPSRYPVAQKSPSSSPHSEKA